jgi:hypothetical protein
MEEGEDDYQNKMGEVIWMEDAHLHPPTVTGFAGRGAVQKL